MLITYNASILL